MNSKIHRFYKRLTAMLLAVCMVFGGVPGQTKILAYTPTELMPVALDMNAGGTTTAYSFKSPTAFDFAGISDGALVGSASPYTGKDSNNVTTTFGRGGYTTYLRRTLDGSTSSKRSVTMNNVTVTDNYNGGVYSDTTLGLEVQIKLSVSPDEKWIFVEYEVYNATDSTVTAEIGSLADVCIGVGGVKSAADWARIDVTSRGLHQVNADTLETFDLVYNEPDIGIKNAAADGFGAWIGIFNAAEANIFVNDNASNAHIDNYVEKMDSMLAYWWKIPLGPYQAQTRKVAFGVKSTSYYVSAGAGSSDDNDGNYNDPLRTIGEALTRLKGRKGYIFMMDNYDPINATIDLGSNSETDITILSTDLNSSGKAVNDIKTLTRGEGFSGPMFRTTGATLRISDLTIDGKEIPSQGSLIEASGNSTVGIQPNTILKNNIITDATKGSAINMTGSAKLDMNGATISGNISAGKGAVHYNATGGFEVRNENQISDNKTSFGQKANVYLPLNKHITVKGDLEDSVIGVTAEKLPAASPGGVSSKAEQEVKIAEPPPDALKSPGSVPFVDNFTADGASDNAEVYVSAGSASLDNEKYAVLKRNGYTVSFVYRDSDTGGGINEAPPTPAESYARGDHITLKPPAPITGYDFTNVIIDQGTGNTLSAQTTPEADFGKVTGIMPGQDVVITYKYTRADGSIAFEANGGTPVPATLTGSVGAGVNALLPSISRYGYRFIGWSTENKRDTQERVTGLPAKYPQDPVTYYAIFKPDSNVKFDYTVDYTNADGSITFQSTTSPKAYSVEDVIEADRKNIHGYLWSSAKSSVSPDIYDYGGTEAVLVGSFDENTGAFSGIMPGQAAAVKYGYQVDLNNPDAVSTFTVNHVSQSSGTVLHTADVQNVFPEAAITAAPAGTYGYQYLSGSITAGNNADNTGENLVNAVQGSFDGNGNFTGIMPNQAVEITYFYESTGEGYEYKINYLDNVTLDARLRDITGPDVSSVTADTAVTAAFRNLYGYLYQSASADPSSAGIFDTGHNFSGIMPNDSLHITYRYDRDSSKWRDLTYRAGANGSLIRGSDTSQDVRSLGSGVYQASVLINDGTAAGAAGSYTWADILSKKLAPEGVGNTYYRLEGWFIDTNGNGIMDGGETLLTPESRFTGPATVVAYFGEDPAQWVDIRFAAGAHGSINAGEATSLHVQYDRTWADIAGNRPAYTPEVNYLTDDWYDGNVPADDHSLLVNGNTYTIRFYPDPAVFGTDVTAPDASAGLDTRGKGRVTVYGTTQGYQYIITDLAGNIVDVVQGNISGRVYFEDLYPGTRYLVYEATGTAQVSGSTIGSVTGTISAPTEVLTPVVETNYQILYDEDHEGKTVLVIKPADPNSDYAILDKNGNIVTTPETGAGGWQSASGSDPTITFSGLDYNEEYVVVARPRGDTGITADSKFADGSSIITDPGGELNIPKYVVETINGLVHTVDGTVLDVTRYEETHKGDEVVLHAEATDANGQSFLYWKALVGTVPGMAATIHRQEVTFTMPDTNVVMAAYYARAAATPSNATVTDEVRGGNQYEMALDPDEIESLEDELTTAADRILMDVNHADVTYKVIFKKNSVKTAESNAVKDSVFYDSAHEAAYHGAWGLDVEIERYVNGRKVSMATPSNATFNTYVQLDKEDVDMMDYQLFAVSVDPTNGDILLDPVAMSDDPEETGGLFTFTAQAGMRYILVYSRAYRIYFINNYSDPKYRYYFKVRRDEAPGDGEYSFEYNQVEEPIDVFVDNDGIEFSYVGWSTREDRLRDFDPDKGIRKATYVYAFYTDNSEEVNDLRKQLEAAIKAAIEKADDYFLTLKESARIREAIEAAMDMFDKTGPRATLAELLAALEQLEETCAPFDKILDDRYTHYDELQNDGNSGGTSGGSGWGSGGSSSSGGKSGGSGGGSGGGGKGPVATPLPFVSDRSKSYVVGSNGNWELVDAAGDRWAFVLNGGIRLTSIWAKLDYANGDVNQNGWYHFNSGGLMDSGWFRDEYLGWYYCNTAKDGWLGKMKTGWHYDEHDKHWYYLDAATGQMAVGWKEIEGRWYYFTPENTAETYYYDSRTEKWVFMQNQERPLGSMYSNEKTPDGYQTGADGALRD